ncbi:hypothetical protein JOD67_001956 [Tenggerimyces flavus]|nr:hypothetical protein [Tenggerimyces flavus]
MKGTFIQGLFGCGLGLFLAKLIWFWCCLGAVFFCGLSWGWCSRGLWRRSIVVAGPGRVKGASLGALRAVGERRRFAIFDP